MAFRRTSPPGLCLDKPRLAFDPESAAQLLEDPLCAARWSLSDFLGLFCHRLLRGTVVASFPERDDNVFRDWPRALAQLRSLLGLRSTYTIHWVFCHIFPELEVAVGRSVIDREVRTQGMVLGTGIWVMDQSVVA